MNTCTTRCNQQYISYEKDTHFFNKRSLTIKDTAPTLQRDKKGHMIKTKLGVHDMQQASHKAEPGDYKYAVNDISE